MDKKRILLIDDETDFCKIVKKNLEMEGDFEVNIAVNCKEGVALAKKMKPDVILLDILMPGMDGFGALELLKRDRYTLEIPVIMVSALQDEATKLKAAQLYNDEYITKPVEFSDLKARIEKVLKWTKGGKI